MRNKLPCIKCSVENFYNKNQFIITTEYKKQNYLIFQSYKSEIAIYNKDTDQLYINSKYVGYSKTTSKHLYLFINEKTIYSCHNLNELKQLIKDKTLKEYRR